MKSEDQIRSYFKALYRAWGRQHWWPGQSSFEVIVGAYLTQNTSWTNVEKAIRGLRRSGLLSLRGIRRAPAANLQRAIRSSGYFRQKARRLKVFVRYLDLRYAGSLPRMFAQSTSNLREELLTLEGVGPETADSILLYAGNRPIFVVDAYTRRILERHALVTSRATYDEIQELFERALALSPDEVLNSAQSPTSDVPGGSSHPPSPMSTAEREPIVQLYNEMHGLIVAVGKNYCKKSQPQCERCPLRKFLPEAQ